MTYRIIFRDSAEQDLEDACLYFINEADDIGLVERFQTDVDDAVSRLHADSVVPSPVPGANPRSNLKRVFLDRFPYSVVFIEKDSIRIVIAVAHMRRRPTYWKGRLSEDR